MIEGKINSALTLGGTTLRHKLLCCLPKVHSWTNPQVPTLSPVHWHPMQGSFPPCLRSPSPVGTSWGHPLNTPCVLESSSQGQLLGEGRPQTKTWRTTVGPRLPGAWHSIWVSHVITPHSNPDLQRWSQTVPDLWWFDFRFFNFMMCKSNHSVETELWILIFSGARHTLSWCWAAGSEPQLPVSHMVTMVNNWYT